MLKKFFIYSKVENNSKIMYKNICKNTYKMSQIKNNSWEDLLKILEKFWEIFVEQDNNLEEKEFVISLKQVWKKYPKIEEVEPDEWEKKVIAEHEENIKKYDNIDEYLKNETVSADDFFKKMNA